MKTIIDFLDDFLTGTGRQSIGPVEANALLAKAGILRDSKDRPGKPLRDLLRTGKLPHAFQSGGKGSSWSIPHSGKPTGNSSNYPKSTQSSKRTPGSRIDTRISATVDILSLKTQLESARIKYKPDRVKYLLVAEAPPDSIDRFFYEGVK